MTAVRKRQLRKHLIIVTWTCLHKICDSALQSRHQPITQLLRINGHLKMFTSRSKHLGKVYTLASCFEL